jgi:hypothetical protein
VARVLAQPKATSAKIGFATIEATNAPLPFDFARALIDSMVPGTNVERYGRVWLMGQHVELPSGRIYGRIGFQQPGAPTEIWNTETKDFETQQLTQGQTSPFLVDPPSLRVAFQLRPGVIDPTTFTSNFQALLNKASQVYTWHVRTSVRGMSWEEWLSVVDRVTELRIKVVRPNPHYGDGRFVHDLIEDVRAAEVVIDAKAEKEGPGIDVDAEWVKESLDHSQTYGDWIAKGQRAGKQVEWRKKVEGQPETARGEANPETGEVKPESLDDALGPDDE